MARGLFHTKNWKQRLFHRKNERFWSQQKYRLSVKDKKSINLRVDKEIEKKN
uniref:hypothetical protein n=1 Tax=Vibrio cholerae TaxID=666 RepID=UPI003F588E3F